jgi:hypothetical protein
MHAAIRLVTKAMVADLGDAIASQVRDYAGGESFDAQNPNAMRRALEWIVEHDRMLERALSGEGYEAVNDLAAEIEQGLQEARG